MMAEELGKLIERERLERGLSSRELARLLKINPQTLHAWVNDPDRKLSYENAATLSKTLGIPLEAIPIYERRGHTSGFTAPSEDRVKKTRRRIKTLRMQSGLTQEELADKIGVSKYTICSWESGRTRNIPSACFDLMADVFNVRPTYLSGVDDDPEDVREISVLTKERPEIATLVKLAKNAPAERIKIICRLLEELNGDTKH